ncbi:insulinase family protein [Geobacillus stearothermophilus]|uniref:M16 family metallopeptidase n=1 Tax=Geobacillus stearothermophilus TaxID=1422 RepID=UPI003D20117E
MRKLTITNVLDSSYVVTDDHVADRARLCLYFKVGSRDDLVEGSIHFFEHLLLQNGSKLFEKLRKKGVLWEVKTLKDFMVFQLSGIVENIEEILYIIIDTIHNFSCSEKQIEIEKSIILQEQITRHAQPNILIQDMIYESLWDKCSGLSHPIVGNAQSLERINISVLEETTKLFCSSDIIVVGSGGFEHKRLVDFVHQAITRSGNLFKYSPPIPEKIISTNKVVRSLSLPVSQVALGFPFLDSELVGSGLELALISYMFAGVHSPLVKKVRWEQGLVYHLMAYPLVHRTEGAFIIHFVSSPANISTITHLIENEIELRKKHGFTIDEIEMAKQYLRGIIIEQLDDDLKYIRSIGDILAIKGQLPTIKSNEILQKVESLNKELIDDLFCKILTPTSGIAVLGETP